MTRKVKLWLLFLAALLAAMASALALLFFMLLWRTLQDGGAVAPADAAAVASGAAAGSVAAGSVAAGSAAAAGSVSAGSAAAAGSVSAGSAAAAGSVAAEGSFGGGSAGIGLVFALERARELLLQARFLTDRYLAPCISIAAVVASAIAGILTLAVSKMCIAPLAAVAKEAGRVASGELGRPVDCGGAVAKGEAAEAAASVEAMRVALKDAVADRLRFDEARRLMVATISHDLRTPVTAIKGYAEGLRDGVAATDAMRARYVATILSKAGDMAGLVDELLDFARFGLDAPNRKYVAVDIGGWLSAEAASLADANRLDPDGAPCASVVFEAEPSEEPVVAMIDDARLRRVLANLAQNCVRHGRVGRRPVSIKIILRSAGGEAVIETRDDGPGIANGDMGSVFEMFYTASPSRNRGAGGDRKGYGLGLAAAKEIVEAHGGQIWARPSPAPEGGASILFTLPIAMP